MLAVISKLFKTLQRHILEIRLDKEFSSFLGFDAVALDDGYTHINWLVILLEEVSRFYLIGLFIYLQQLYSSWLVNACLFGVSETFCIML